MTQSGGTEIPGIAKLTWPTGRGSKRSRKQACIKPGRPLISMTFPTDIGSDNMQLVYDILKDHNIVFKDDQKVERRYQRPTPVWDWIDTSAAEYNKASSDTDSIGWFEDMLTLDSRQIHLPFSVRYQLEVCISQNILSEFTMTREFLLRLLRMREAAATQLLEQVATCKRAYADPMDIFSITYAKGVTNSKIPAYCCFMRTARITPTTIYYNTPTVDISNRVTRRYREHADRFLRVRFTDEKSRGRIMPTPTSSDDEIFTRGDRHYEFLAFGNSQFREHGAYFFASTPHLKASQIRGWMGQFSHIKNVARHAARIGQCFSTTRAVVGCPVEVKKCDEISRNGQCFSDGVGKISRFLAQMTTEELKFQTIAGRYPCAFQFRLGGSKGMLVVSDDPQPKEVHIRPSQDKFPSDHTGLEIIRHSQYSPASLNRQLILVLSSLGIPDAIICKKLRGMLEDLDVAMENHHGAIETLNKLIDPNQITASLAHVLECGFRREKEPFINSVVALWKSWHMKSVKEKARIVINQGASLLGCIDEIGVLKGHFDKKIPRGNASYDERVAALPEIFVQIDLKHKDRADTFQIIEGICIVARNPSLHPGDIRVVRAVNRPELKNLHNVVVFPQTGDQVITSMCSGGDLDGDDYTVIWDQDLIPKDWFVKPMKYTSRKAPDFNGNVTVNEIISFFVTYMKNDSLPRIAHAHMALADRLENGVLEKKCMQLAQLHSDAVDYNKTGAVAIMTRDLEPRLWPHFMEKKHKRPEQIYHSEKILGQLYDAVEVPDYAPNLSLPFDERVLNSPYAPASLKWTELATQLKSEYDAAIRRVMAQYEIQTEFEVWSSFVLGHNQLCRDYNLSEELGRKNSILQDGVRQQCYDKVGSRTMESMAPFVVAAYRVTSEEVKVALQEGANNKGQTKFDDAESVDSEDLDSSPQTPLISFPWIFKDILCQIVQGRIKVQNPDNAELDTGKMYSHADVIAVLDELQKSPESGVIEEGSIWKNVAATGGSDPERDSDPGSKVSDKDLHTGERNDIVEAEDVSKTNLPAVEKLLSLIGETDA
ncbi:RNA-dependent RNA polymerase eukaryotic-type [Penicillium chermesinum]|uniref:RNA-dependent RNA polymerase n=1 Tax=Penicillium chermesinum TaxID=63820 RepID=A0A9W9NHQ0_9EURO|nr:RNA-dependent RNA polymerase eukaryotic-type [Penicillium chermesinum]KAJ5220072.1 RNA-dependent RNA polymerase eukaryotic-type [Penicillium chermesinum]